MNGLILRPPGQHVEHEPYNRVSIECVKTQANIKKRSREETSLSIGKIFAQERDKLFRENKDITYLREGIRAFTSKTQVLI